MSKFNVWVTVNMEIEAATFEDAANQADTMVEKADGWADVQFGDKYQTTDAITEIIE